MDEKLVCLPYCKGRGETLPVTIPFNNAQIFNKSVKAHVKGAEWLTEFDTIKVGMFFR